MTAAARERGSAAIVTVALIALLMMVTLACAAVAGLVVCHRRAQTAADLAALAAAVALRDGGSACGIAEQIAAAHDARLRGCAVDGVTVTVEVVVAGPSYLGREVDLAGRARAGPG